MMTKLPQQRIDEIGGRELQQVGHLLADAGEADGGLSSWAMATAMPPLAVPSSLVSTMPVAPAD